MTDPHGEPHAERACERCEWCSPDPRYPLSLVCRFRSPSDDPLQPWPTVQQNDWCAQFKERKG